jgi:PRTRC genetic system protein C
MEVTKGTREFKYNGVALADPGPQYSLEQVREVYAAIYPEIVNADIEGPTVVGSKTVYEFRRAVGTKGAVAADVVRGELFAAMGGAMPAPQPGAPASFAFDLDGHKPAMKRVKAAIEAALSNEDRRACAPAELLAPLP